MQTEQTRLLDFLAQPDTRFAVPVFQRVYSWGKRECVDFWNDVVGSVRADGEGGHFMGVVLHSEDAEGWRQYRQVNVIDGQQRLTTVTLLLVALAHYLRETGGEAGGLSADDICNRYLQVGDGDAAEGKLILTYLDKYTLFSLVGGLELPEEHARRIVDNYGLFAGLMREPGFDVQGLWRGLEALEIVSVRLEGGDNPQLVFESLNSKGMSLVTGDLVRNQLLMAAGSGGPQAREELYDKRWRPIEDAVDGLGDPAINITTLLHAWLAGKFRSVHIHDETEVYGVFRQYLSDEFDGSFAELLDELEGYAGRFVADDLFRREAMTNAKGWLEGRPQRFVSELKLFGD